MQFEIQAEKLEEYILRQDSYCTVDMRTPGEFQQFHIPHALSYPILTDEEHKEVGTLYVAGQHQEAKLTALSYALPKVSRYTKDMMALKKEYEHVVLYCSRGGMRSRVFYAMLRAMGLSVQRLAGGYKEYRQFVRQRLTEFTQEKEFIVLHGKTGVGKTEILKSLKKEGASILDLEGLARHRGSSFGGVGLGDQPSQKMFESLLYETLLTSTNPIYTEGESNRIGQLFIPKELFLKINQGKRIVIEDEMIHRVERIKMDYLQGTQKEMLASLDRLQKYLSKDKYRRFYKKIEEKEYEEVIEALITDYYDSHYAKNYKDSDPHLFQGKDILQEIFTLEDSFFPSPS